MNASWIRPAVLLSLAVVMALGGTASALSPAQPPVAFQLTTLAASTTEDDMNAEIDGRLVAWENRAGTADPTIAVFDLATSTTRYVGLEDGRQQSEPDVSGDRVVYSEYDGLSWNTRMYSWATNSSTNVAITTSHEVGAKMDGTIVVWHNLGDGYLYYLDYDNPAAGTVRLDRAGTNAVDWDVENGRIYWSNPTYQDLTVAMIHPPLWGPQQLTAFGGQPEFTDWHGDNAVFATMGGTLWEYNFRRRTHAQIATGASGQQVFDTTRAWASSGDVVYRRPYHQDSTIGQTEAANRLSLYGHRIVWDRNDGADWDIVLATGLTKLSNRTYGANRYATAAAVSREYFEAGDFVYWPYIDNLVLCTGENFPDALAAAPLARALQAPLLLTKRDSLPPETMAEITRLAPTKIYIVGGAPAVSTAIENQLKAMYAVERIAGADRYETSAKVATKLAGLLDETMYRAFFARGDLFPDALALGPVAAGAQGPVLLVKPTAVPASVAAAVNDLDIKRGWVAGDATAVSNATVTQLGGLIAANGGNPNITRLAGANRYDTAVAIVNAGLANNWIDLDVLGVATGMNFPDALGGGSAMGYYGSPVILTGTNAVPAGVGAFVDQHAYEIGRIDVFGGTDVVGSGVMSAVLAKVK